MGDALTALQRLHDHEQNEGGFSMIAHLPFHEWLRAKLDLAEGLGARFDDVPQDLSQAAEDALERVCAAYLKIDAIKDELVANAFSDDFGEPH